MGGGSRVARPGKGFVMNMEQRDAKAHISYAEAGVDVDEGARAVEAIKADVASTRRPEVIGGLGGFGCLFSAANLKDMEDPVLVSGTDGVGTKLALAQLLGRNQTVGQDLVAMCVDDIAPVGAEPLFFLDYIAIGKLEAGRVEEVISGIADGCRMSGCALIGGEMAEHPVVMKKWDYDLAGFAVGVVDRPRMLGPELVREGDVVLGLPSSGIHSNGYSLVRRLLGTDGLEPGTPEAEAKVAELSEPLDELGGESLADAVMRPTTIYAKTIVDVLAEGTPIHAMAHITGGGITENLNRSIPAGLAAQIWRGDEAAGGAENFEDGCGNPVWDVPPVIRYMVRAANLTPAEAYKTFNMGMGMAVICAAEDEEAVVKSFASHGYDAFRAGTIIAGTPGAPAYVTYK